MTRPEALAVGVTFGVGITNLRTAVGFALVFTAIWAVLRLTQTRQPRVCDSSPGEGLAANPRLTRHSFPGARGRVTSHSLPPRSVT